MRPSPYRWIPIILIALILMFWISADLLPRFVGGLLGRGDNDLGAWSRAGTELPEIVWDPTDPRVEEAQVPVDVDQPSESESSETEMDVEADPDTEIESSDPQIHREKTAEAGQAETASGNPSSAAAGEGPGEGRRRAARLLYQEWPRESVLADLKVGGHFRFRLRVEADGHVSDWEIIESFDCEPCAAEAERIVKSLRFRPALEDGRPAACWLPFEIGFYASGKN
jgi:outer membrane biosynthesis protein TonB